ncbi:endonuclease/exonuclease/phosphatase family protein [Georgenia sp. Z1344]|uniref:endonuclease/exonuclease/phosphatase family protein n=1 Tax=Georgenia sp. Z1344 TaxID=3416706 RepID=UPI003CF04E78
MTAGRPIRVATVNLQHGTPASGGGPRLPADVGTAPTSTTPTGTAPARAGACALHPDHASLVAAGRALAALDLDVVALQEVDRGQRRSRYVDQARVLARMLGTSWWRLAAAEVGPRGGPRLRPLVAPAVWQPGYGVALLSRLPVRAWHAWSFPAELRLLRPGHPLAQGGPVLRVGPRVLRRDEARVALAAQIDAPGGPLAVAATHLSTRADAARAQLRTVTERLTALPGTHVLAGDLNLGPDDVAAATGLTPLAVGPTFPARRPHRQIDHVLGTSDLVASGEVHRLPVSDHLTLVATITDARVAGAHATGAS